jgi:hypothetical protein
MKNANGKNNHRTDDVKTIGDQLRSRSGRAFLPPYLEQIGMLDRLDQTFGNIRKIDRGLKIREAFKQFICFFVDGTELSLSRFHELKEKKGYYKTIQTDPDPMACFDRHRSPI